MNSKRSDIDQLLRELYLEENSTAPNEQEAEFVFDQNYHAHINRKKEQQLLNRLGVKKKRFWNWKMGLSLLTAIVSIFTVILLLTPFSAEKTEGKQGEMLNKDFSAPSHVVDGKDNEFKERKTTDISVLNEKSNTQKQVSKSTIKTVQKPMKNAFIQEPTVSATKNVVELPVPMITSSEKVYYLKVKEQTLLKLLKTDKAFYSFIALGKVTYSGDNIEIHAFTIRNMGITNLEYRTFLVDLIIQKRYKDYELAKVNTNNWHSHNCSTLEKEYFQNQDYDDFPVVNVTQKGALLFCNWLQEESIKYAQFNELKSSDFSIRLPEVKDWVYISREGYARFSYDDNYNTIYDVTEPFVNESFANRAALIKKKALKKDTLYQEVTTNRYGWKEKNIIDFYNKAWNYNMEVRDYIDADRMKVYGKIGRVSEITIDEETEKVWLVGKSWDSKDDYERLVNEFERNSSSPFVGFRIIVNKPNDPDYKNPFW